MGEGDQNTAKLEGMLGLARRAGKITFGMDAVMKDITTGKTRGVILAVDASERTGAKVKGACETFSVRLAVLPLTKQSLGKAIGRDETAVAAVGDKSFADKIFELAGATQRNPIQGGNSSE